MTDPRIISAYLDLKPRLLLLIAQLETEKFKDYLRDSNVALFEMIDDKGFTVLHEIIMARILQSRIISFIQAFVEVAKEQYGDQAASLISEYANLTTPGDKRTVLHIAVETCQCDIVQELIQELGCNLQAVDYQGNTAVHLAAARGSEAIMVLLIDSYAQQSTAKNGTGQTPLHLASQFGHNHTVDLLLARTKDPNTTDSQGQTPLHLATENKMFPTIALLKVSGARNDIRDEFGRTPLDIAYESGDKLVVDAVKRQTCWAHLNPLSERTPQVKYRFFVAFQIFSALKYVPFYLLVVPIIPVWGGVVTLVIGLTAIALFLVVSYRNPGYIPKSKKPLLKLYENYKPIFICARCKIKRPFWARHCYVCNRCVLEYNHHSLMVNNCIGKRNFLWYFLLVIAIELDFVWFTIICLMISQDVFIGDGVWPEMLGVRHEDFRIYSFWISICSIFVQFWILPSLVMSVRHALSRQKLRKSVGNPNANKMKLAFSMRMSAISNDSYSMTTSSLLQKEDNDSVWSNETESSKPRQRRVHFCCWSYMVDEDPEVIEAQIDDFGLLSEETNLNGAISDDEY